MENQIENNDRAVDPSHVIQYLQNFLASELSRYATELACRDAYIQSLEIKIKTLEEKLDG